LDFLGSEYEGELEMAEAMKNIDGIDKPEPIDIEEDLECPF
jgi:hypothetical protein